jgi:uncharacterized protein
MVSFATDPVFAGSRGPTTIARGAALTPLGAFAGMAWMPRLLGLICLAWSLLAPATALALEPPPLSARVTDLAGLLSSAERARLEDKLAAYERESGHQFALLTLPSLDGDPIEDYSIRVVEKWQLGKKGKDDGLLLLIAKNDRKMRIEVGYGLEGSITDAVSARVIRGTLTPAFRSGDYGAGIERAFDVLMLTASGKAPAVSERDERKGPDVVGRIIGFFIAGLILFPFLALLAAVFFANGRSGRPGGRSTGIFFPPSGGFGGGGFGGGGFGGGGGGGFSGGGGSFGGGGSSGSW